MRKFLSFIFLILITGSAHAADAYNNWWQKGTTYYGQKQYDSAAYYFEQVAALKPMDAVVYYNLGNAYYRLNKIGPAVLNYKRSLHLDPDFKEAQDNLTLSQNRIPNRIQGADDIFFIQWWMACTAGNKANMWAVIALSLFLLWIGMLIAARMGKFRTLPVKANVTTGALLTAMLILAYAAAHNRSDSQHAVIMYQDTPLMNAPKEGKYQSLIPEGTTVKLEGENAGWIEVQLPDGRIGWIQKDLLTKI